MLIIFCCLLTLGVGRCKNSFKWETITAAVGDEITMTCPREKSEINVYLFWIRFINGKWPEFLGGTYSFDYIGDDTTSHIAANQGPESYNLSIRKVKQNDTGLYYCIKVDLLNMMFLKGQLLLIKGTEPNITAIVQHPLPDRVHPGSPVSLQCSIFFNAQDKTCSADNGVYWFQTGSDKSHPSFIYAHENRGNECEQSPEDHSGRKCVYNFSKNVSASDVGTYYCAVATCGVVLFGNGTKLDIEEPNMWDLQKTNTVYIVLYTILTASLIVIFILSYMIMKKTCCCSNDAVSGHYQQTKQRDEGSIFYAAPTLISGKSNRKERKNKETEAVYSAVRGLEIDQ